MDQHQRKLIRMAIRIQANLLHERRQNSAQALRPDEWLELQRINRLLATARRHGWDLAAARLIEDQADAVSCLQSSVNIWRLQRQASSDQTGVSTAHNIYQDLVALRQEFDQFDYDQEQDEFCATTGSITLQGVGLGPFEIRLAWRRLTEFNAYRIVALEPNPAQSNDSVTHPHVNGEQLCEGEGHVAIRTALSQGRLYDFFTIVLQTLSTYAEGRYVELDDWYGVHCHDCSDMIDFDDRDHCERCSETLCNQCSICCPGCDYSYCAGCLNTCPACEELYCSGCIKTCPKCQASVCDDCAARKPLWKLP